MEGLVAPACETLFAARGIPVHDLYHRVRTRMDSRTMEVDLLVSNTDVVVLVEAKSTLAVDDVRQFLDRLPQFREFFPRYADCRVLGAVAAIVMEGNAAAYAMNQGLFVLTQNDETVSLANAETFVAREW